MGFDPAPFVAVLFLCHKKAEWVKAQRKLRTTNVRKINNSFRFIHELLFLNDDSVFQKHCEYIYPTQLELEKENNSNFSLVPFFFLYIHLK